MSEQGARDPATRWRFTVFGLDARATVQDNKVTTVVGVGSTVDEVRRRAEELLRQGGYGRATIHFSPSDAVEVEFFLERPCALDALRIRFLAQGIQHLTGQDIAHILDVDLRDLHAALKPLVDRQMLEIMDQGEVNETWVLGLQMRKLDELLELAKRHGITLDAPLRRRPAT